MIELNGPALLPESGDVRKLVVFLHGLGADGNDLISLADELIPDLAGTAFVSPNAPFACDMAPYGYQWFSLQERTPEKIVAGVKIAAPILDHFLDAQLKQYGLKPKDMALVGFSQGTMMALYTALRRKEPVAGVLGFSGALVGGETLPGEIKSRPPVCLVHGDQDAVVPYDMMQLAAQQLYLNQVPVEAHTAHGIGHGIDPFGLATAIRFLRSVLMK